VTPPETSALTVEISNLRGDITGFRTDIAAVSRDLSDIKTSCAVLIARSDRTEQDVRDLRKELEDEVKKIREDEVKPLKADVASLKGRQWPLQSVAGLASATAIGLGIWSVFGR
jgi:predicted  nucleic acid-binding Zn-ribbon protein